MPRSRRRPISGLKSTSVTTLPDELVIEFLIWLPGDQLAQCKCVCKSWRSIIGSPPFLEAYRSRQPGLILHSSSIDHATGEVARVRFYHCPLRRLNEPTEEFSSLYLMWFNSRSSSMSQMVNGLTCLWELESGNDLSIHNVCTGEAMTLPDPARYTHTTSVFRIGYDPASRTYKLLRLILRFGTRRAARRRPLQAEIMTLRPSDSPSTWRRLDCREAGIVDLPVQSILGNNYSRLSETRTFPEDGVLSWLIPGGMIYFDVNREKFRWVKLPEDVEDGQKIIRARSTESPISLSLWFLPWGSNLSGPKWFIHYKLEEDDEGNHNRWSKICVELPEEVKEMGMEGDFVVGFGNPPSGGMLLMNPVKEDEDYWSRTRPVYCYEPETNKMDRFLVGELPEMSLDSFGILCYHYATFNARIVCLLDSNNLYLSLDEILSGL